MSGRVIEAGVRAGGAARVAARESSGTGLALGDFLPYRLSRAATRVSKALAGVYSERFSLSIAQWRVLATLQAEPGLTGRDVASRSALDKVAVSRAVAALAQRGLLERRPMSEDGRSSRLQLSRRGAGLFRRIAPLALEWEEQLLAPLSRSEREQFLSLLGRLEANVTETAPQHQRGGLA